jgi:SAM-dependent methyltransferase
MIGRTTTKRTKKTQVVSCLGVFVALLVPGLCLSASAMRGAHSALRDPRPATQRPPSRPPDVHFAATPQPVADAMLKLARVTSTDVVYDLGSGDGRIVILAAQKYGARGVGIEIVPELVERSRLIAEEGDVADRATFIEGDLFTADISPATVVTLWLTASVNARLEPKLLRELRPGTRIVAHQFPIGQWAPEQTIRFDGEELFLWTVPPR